MKLQRRVIASMLVAVVVLMLLTVFPHAETVGQNPCDNCSESGNSQSSVLKQTSDIGQNSSAEQVPAVVQGSCSNPMSSASQSVNSGQSSAVSDSPSSVQASAASHQSSSSQSVPVQPSSSAVSSVVETPKNAGPVSLSETIQNACSISVEIPAKAFRGLDYSKIVLQVTKETAQPDVVSLLKKETASKNQTVVDYCQFDISLLYNGKTVEPAVPLKITFSGLKLKKGDKQEIYYVDETQKALKYVNTQANPTAGKLVIETPHLSTYLAVSQKAVLTDATISPQTIADGLVIAADFAVFANTFTLRGDMEGNVAVRTFAATTGNIGNSANIYTNGQSTFDLTISISGIARKNYQVGIYSDAAAKKQLQKVPLTADSSGNATKIVPGLDSKTVYYAYLLDKNEDPIIGNGTSQQGVTGGGSVIYSGNDNYIQTLTKPLPISWGIFQNAQPGSTVIPLSVTFGNKYLIYHINGAYNTTGDGNCNLVNSSNRQNVMNPIGGGIDNTVSVKDTFPFVFNDVFTNLLNLSKTLAGAKACNRGTMRVINVIPSGNDENALRDALRTVLGYDSDQNALSDPNKGIQLADSQYLVVNVDCGNNTSVTIPKCCIGNVPFDRDWNDISSRILWNFYGSNSSLTVYTKSGVLGTILAPSATVNYGSTMNGAIYADTVYNDTGEIHKMTFRPTQKVNRSISFTDHCTAPVTLPETGGPGTGIFYLVGGGILFLAAVAVLIYTVAKQIIFAKGKQLFHQIGGFLQKHSLSIYRQRTENNSS